ncbi:MAG: Mur ligase domain-containing protein, partial [Polyangiaceae bacterium]
MRVHLVGAAGAEMGALAALLREEGDDVSGSDVAFDPPSVAALRGIGVRCEEGYDAAHVERSPRPDLVVVGSAIPPTNPEAQAAERLDLPRASTSRVLRLRFLSKRRPLVVAGTHGKTTTSAMCAWLLSQSGYKPGWFVGGVPNGLSASAAIGSPHVHPSRGRSPFVVDGDEHGAVYWDKGAKLLDYAGVAPDEVAILTCVEHERADINPGAESYQATFRAFVRAVPEGGLIV